MSVQEWMCFDTCDVRLLIELAFTFALNDDLVGPLKRCKVKGSLGLFQETLKRLCAIAGQRLDIMGHTSS